MDSDGRTAQLIHQRYQDTSLVIFRQAQEKLKRELTYKNAGSSGKSAPDSDVTGNVNAASNRHFSNPFRRRLQSKSTQSSICNII